MRTFASLLLTGLVSCTSPGGTTPRSLTPISEMPQEDRELLLAYGRGGAQWARLREELVEDPDRARWMCENLVLELFRAYDRSRLAGIGDERGPFERARAELVLLHDHSVVLLVELLSARDGVVPVVCADVLTRIGEPAVPEVAAALGHPDPRARRMAAEILGSLPNVGREEDDLQVRLAEVVAGDPEWIVRAQAVRALGLRGANHRTPLIARRGLLTALVDEDPAVRREAAAALAGLGDPAAVPALLNYLERSVSALDPRGRDAAQAALEVLTGTDERRDSRGWREFWREHAAELLDPAEDRPY